MGLIKLRGRRLYALMKIICGASFAMYGYDAGVLGGMLLHKPFLEAMGNPTATYVIPMIVASYDLAAFVTSVGIAFFTFNIGRRGTVIMGNAVAIVGAIIQASSYSVAQIIVGRLLTGFAIGCISSSVPTYLNETGSKITDRGPANAINAMFLIGGVPVAYWIDLGFVHWNAQASWRIPIVLQCIFAIVSGGTMYFLPDTPRWYYARNRFEEGDAVLSQLYDEPIESETVQETRRQIMTNIEIELEASSSLHWKQFLTFGIVDRTRLKIIRRLSICFWIPMIGEWMGVSLIGYFSTVILARITTGSLVSILAGVLTTCAFLGTVPLYWTIERFGRRSIMLGTACVSTVIFTIFIVLVAVGGPASHWPAIAMLLCLTLDLTYGWQGIKFLYTSEVAPLEYRHIGAAAASSGEWLMVFITVFAGPIGLDTVGWKLWLFPLSGNVVAVIFVFLLCPETGGKTLEQVDYLFVEKGFAGLRKNFDVNIEDIEAALGKKDADSTDHVEQSESKVAKH